MAQRRGVFACSILAAVLVVPGTAGAAQDCSTAWQGALNVHKDEKGALNVNKGTQVWETGDRVLGVDPGSLKQQKNSACFEGDGADPGTETQCLPSERVESFSALGLLPSRPNNNFDPADDISVADGQTVTVNSDINPTQVTVDPGGTLIIEGDITINTQKKVAIGDKNATKKANVIVNGVSGEITRLFGKTIEIQQGDVDVTEGAMRTINDQALRITAGSNINCGSVVTSGDQRSCSDTDGSFFGISKSSGNFADSHIRAAAYVDGTQFNMSGVVFQGAATGGGMTVDRSTDTKIGSDVTLGQLPNTDGFCEQPGPGNALTTYQMEQFQWDGTTDEVVDISGNDHDATASGDADTDGTNAAIGGDPGTCRHGFLDGSDDFIEDPDAGNYLNGLAGLTVMGWVRNTAGIGNDNGVFSTTSASGKDNNLGLRYDDAGFSTGNDNIIKASINTDHPDCDDGEDCLQVETEDDIQVDGEWQHIAMVWETNAKIRIYVDGREVETTVSGSGIGVHQGTIDSVDFLRVGQSEKTASDGWQGDIDEFMIFDGPLTALEIQDLMQDTHPCPVPGAAHYAIDHSGTLVSCDTETVTVTAHDANDNPVDATDATIDLSTDTGEGTWARVITGSGTLSDATAGDGAGSYTFPDNGETAVQLAFNYTTVNAGNPETVDIDVVDGKGATEDTGEDPDLTVSHSGFRITDGADNAINVPTQIAGKPSDTAPGSQSLGLQAIRTSDDDPSQCEPAYPDGTTVEVELGAECKDPASCAGRELAVTNDGTTTAIDTSDDNGATGAASYEAVDLLFGADAEADLVLGYPDAGAVQLHARDNPIDDGTTSPPVVEYITGSSNDFVVRPFGFYLDFDPDGDGTYDDRAANASCGTQTSCSEDASGDVFATAGAEFALRLAAVVWQSGDDADDDGRPDGNRILADNAETPNFGQEATAETVDLTHTLVAPSPGTAGGLDNATGIGGFSGGAHEVTELRYSEVGIIDLDAALSDGAYLGTVDVTGAVADVGRFIPADFAVSVRDAGMYAATCAGTFSYVGEAFGYDLEPMLDITARNAAGATTENYRGNFIKLAGGDVDVTPPTSDASAIGNVSGTTDVAVTPALNTGAVADDGDGDALGNGVLVYTFDAGDTYTYDKVHNARIDAFTADLPITVDDVTDADGVSDGDLPSPNPFTPTGVEIRFGRLVIDDAFGPEIAPVEQRWRIEYWQGTNWAANTADGCTSLGLNGDVELDGDGGTSPGDATVTLNDSGGTGTTEIVDNALDVIGGRIVFTGGAADVRYSAPGEGERGWIGVASVLGSDHGHLLVDDNDDGGNDGPYDVDPGARVTFGVFAGESENIYLREVFPAP